MHDSLQIFVYNEACRGIRCSYGEKTGPDGKPTDDDISLYKTLDPGISVGHFVLVRTGTRHGMTVVKVEETDVEPNFESNKPVNWIIAVVDDGHVRALEAQEADANSLIKRAHMRKRRAELYNDFMADAADEIKALPIAKEGA